MWIKKKTKQLHGASIMAQRVKALAKKPDELSSIPGPTWRRKNTICCPNSTYMPLCTYPHPFPFPNYCPPPLPALQFPPSTQQWWEREMKNKPKGQIKPIFKRISQHPWEVRTLAVLSLHSLLCGLSGPFWGALPRTGGTCSVRTDLVMFAASLAWSLGFPNHLLLSCCLSFSQ